MITVEVMHGLLKNICSHILYYIFIAEIYTRMGFEEIFVILTWIKKSLIIMGTPSLLRCAPTLKFLRKHKLGDGGINYK